MAVVAVLALIVIDQLSKAMAERYLLDRIIRIIPDFFHFELSKNPGAAWSFLADQEWGIIVLSLASILVSSVVLYYLGICEGYKARIVLVLIAAGGIGNLIDRIRLGKVTDFISFIFGPYRFPIFNLADAYVTCGVILAFLFLLIDKNFLTDLAGKIPHIDGDAM